MKVFYKTLVNDSFSLLGNKKKKKKKKMENIIQNGFVGIKCSYFI